MSSPSRMHLAAGRSVQAGQQAEQRAFAAARRPHDGGKLAARDFEIDAFEDFHTVSAGVDGLGESADLNQPLLWHSDEQILAVGARGGCCAAAEAGGTRAAARRPWGRAPRSAQPPAADPRPAIVVFGDSISAGFGLDAGAELSRPAAAGSGRRAVSAIAWSIWV